MGIYQDRFQVAPMIVPSAPTKVLLVANARNRLTISCLLCHGASRGRIYVVKISKWPKNAIHVMYRCKWRPMEQDEDSSSTDAEQERRKQHHHLQFKGREGEIPRWAQIHVETTAMREANGRQQQ